MLQTAFKAIDDGDLQVYINVVDMDAIADTVTLFGDLLYKGKTYEVIGTFNESEQSLDFASGTESGTQ